MEKGFITKRFKLLAPLLDERQLRLYVAAEALALGRGGISLTSQATGVSRPTITIGSKNFWSRTQPRPLRVPSQAECENPVEGENEQSIWTKRFAMIWRA